ncbi:hypothetical protein ACIBL3_16495 [Kribbella sp. NPDC050124]|uniref:hypothetical protein n=1 Tax=Kribbella sp. NPDC050124 TaxID=3364114 RepID=UPI0037A4343F
MRVVVALGNELAQVEEPRVDRPGLDVPVGRRRYDGQLAAVLAGEVAGVAEQPGGVPSVRLGGVLGDVAGDQRDAVGLGVLPGAALRRDRGTMCNLPRP